MPPLTIYVYGGTEVSHRPKDRLVLFNFAGHDTSLRWFGGPYGNSSPSGPTCAPWSHSKATSQYLPPASM